MQEKNGWIEQGTPKKKKQTSTIVLNGPCLFFQCGCVCVESIEEKKKFQKFLQLFVFVLFY